MRSNSRKRTYTSYTWAAAAIRGNKYYLLMEGSIKLIFRG